MESWSEKHEDSQLKAATDALREREAEVARLKHVLYEDIPARVARLRAIRRKNFILNPIEMEDETNHAVVIALGDEWDVAKGTTAWHDLEDNLMRLREDLQERVLKKDLVPDEAAAAVRVVDAVLQMPASARARADYSKSMLRAQGTEPDNEGKWSL